MRCSAAALFCARGCVKTQAESDGGDGFYWYEVFSATDPSAVVADGQGELICPGCHAAGLDLTLSRFPLR